MAGVYTKEDLKALRFYLRLAQLWARRAPEIIEGLEHYEAELARIRQESGYLAAEAKVDQFRTKREELCGRIVGTPARTPRGILAKLRLPAGSS